MATILNTSAFNADNFWSALQGAPILQNNTTYRFQNSAGQFVEVTGTGLTYAGSLPSGGTYTSIKVYPNNTFSGATTSTLTAAAAVNFATFFTSGLATALSGNDSFTGSTGADNFRGGAGTDSMSGGAGNDTFRIVFGDNVGAETISGGTETDRIVVSGAGESDFSDDVISSTEQLQILNGATAHFAGAQAVALGAMQVIGDNGVNNIRFSHVQDINLSNWTFSGWDNYGSTVLIQADFSLDRNDVITGTSVRDNIHGEGGNDSLVGLGGDDFFSGGLGNDTLVGGAGNDTYYITDNTDTIIEDANSAIGGNEDIVLSTISYTLQTGVDKIILLTEAGASTATGNSGDNQLNGNEFANTLSGLNGNDTLSGNAGNDTLIGGAGNDTYNLTDYNDTVVEDVNGAIGGTGDTIISTVSFIIGDGIENLVLRFDAGATDGIGNSANNTLTGNDARNSLAGETGNDTLIGNGGDDIINGGIGADSMIGGDGVDTYYVDNAGDVIVETQANVYDTVWATVANFTLPDNVEIYIANPNSGSMNGIGNDATTLMLGNEGANILNSLGGNDIVLGGGGNDTINSGLGGDPAGYEVISGGTGNDSMTGGGGHDFFVYTNINEGGDTITDFATSSGIEDDILDFRSMWSTFTNTVGVSTVAQAVTSGHLTYTQVGANTQVFGDANGGAHGAGEQVLIATLLNTTAASVQTYTLI